MKTACLMPFYNEESRMEIAKFRQVIGMSVDVDFWLLNDGSTDGTLAMLQQLESEFNHVYLLDSAKNLGKAEIIRRGVLHCADENNGYEIIGFLDSDFATPYKEFERLLELMKASGYHIVWGSRVKLKGWKIKRHALRHWFSRVVLTIVNEMFQLEIYDTQCGCKLYNAKVAKRVFSESFVTKWLFDIEVFIRYKREFGFELLLEQPLLEWTEIKGSKIKFKDFLLVPWNIIQLWWHFRI